jgi:hypothetical protein
MTALVALLDAWKVSWPVLVKLAVPAVLESKNTKVALLVTVAAPVVAVSVSWHEVVVDDGGVAGRAGVEEPRQRIRARGDGGVAALALPEKSSVRLLVIAMLPAVVPARNSVSPLLTIDVMPETSAFTIDNVAGSAATVTGPASAACVPDVPSCRVPALIVVPPV